MCIKPLETDFTISGDIHYEGETYKKYINEKWVEKNIKRQTSKLIFLLLKGWSTDPPVLECSVEYYL